MSEIKYFKYKNEFVLESGESIDDLTIAYHTYGKINEAGDNVIWVFHALSANSEVLDWWKGLFGKGCYYDPEKYFIICANAIGSPYGSSMPEDLSFPQFSMRDVVKAHLELAKELNINRIYTAIGGSMGGNQALEFAYSYQGQLDNLILIASCARESAWGIAVHESQRVALGTDPTFGIAGGGSSGMKAARSMAMLTYRTSDAFIEQQTDGNEKIDDFRASSYIQYQGDKFVKRFNALSYYYLTKCLDSHNIGRGRGGEVEALHRITVPTLVVGIDSDVLIPIRFQKFIAANLANGTYEEIHSEYGHDGFLVETDKLTDLFKSYFRKKDNKCDSDARTVLKFGGKSLANGKPLVNALDIVSKQAKQGNSLAVIVSARGDSTDKLISLYDQAAQGFVNAVELDDFFVFQSKVGIELDFTNLKNQLLGLLNAVSLLGGGGQIARDRILAFGELISAMTVTELLKHRGLSAICIDSKELIKTDSVQGKVEVDLPESRKATQSYFKYLDLDIIPVITGFFGADKDGNTVTLGRNGSNYSATLIANFIDAKEVQNWTDIDGIYTANPKYVKNAKKIEHLSFREANELANSGTNILHAKTILPLVEHSIPLKIFNSLSPEKPGTIIDRDGSQKGIKAVSVIENVSLVTLEGRGLLGKVGIDARIFSALGKENISVRLISQASSERGIGFVVDSEDAARTEFILSREFENELRGQDVSNIQVNNDMAIVAIVGKYDYTLEKAIRGLRKNKIWIHLISNSINGEHISLVIDSNAVKKAMNVVHNHVFGVLRTLHLFAFGKGRVGKKLLDQIIETSDEVVERRNLKVNILGVADTKNMIFDAEGLGEDWYQQLQESKEKSDLDKIIRLLQNSGLENIVIADNTASQDIAEKYPELIQAGFDIVASNKKANSSCYKYYKQLRKELKQHGKLFYYETNVGAALPIIDTIKHLYNSSDTITRIKGVFSGSLSYIFNNFSVVDKPFSVVLGEAQTKGFTEPDPREDLSGMDVVRKLVILAREIGVKVEIEDVELQNLVPEHLQSIESYEDFIAQKDKLDAYFADIKNSLADDEVLRYVGDMDAVAEKLQVKLVKAKKTTPLGNIQNADSIFEIYTEEYGQQPIIIQGAGAGAEVTARGLYSDLLKIGSQH